jgi:F0F1-type ATP synthase epsilon subunit
MSDAKTIPGAAKEANETVKSVTAYESKPTPGLLRVKVYTPFKTFYEGDARSLTACNETGKFDILPGHHNFISMLIPCDVLVETPEKQIKTIPTARGLLHIKEDKLIIFMDV